MKALLERVLDGEDLSEEEAGRIMQGLAEGDMDPAVGGAFLAALRTKGETSEEVRGFASTMRRLAVPVYPRPGGPPLVDTCGTGGDGSGSLNLSTAAGLIAAAAGARVVKHGNRSISSKSGSADVLEAAGINLSLNPELISQCIEEIGVGFMFAPAHHSAMKHAIGPRKELAI